MALKGVSDRTRRRKGLWKSAADVVYVLSLAEEIAEASAVIGAPGVLSLGESGAMSRVQAWFNRQDNCGCLHCWLGREGPCGEGEPRSGPSGTPPDHPETELPARPPTPTEPPPTGPRPLAPEDHALPPNTGSGVTSQGGSQACSRCNKPAPKGTTCVGACGQRWHRQCADRDGLPMPSGPDNWWCGRCEPAAGEVREPLPDLVGPEVQVGEPRCSYNKCGAVCVVHPLRCAACQRCWHWYCASRDKQERPSDRGDTSWKCDNCR